MQPPPHMSKGGVLVWRWEKVETDDQPVTLQSDSERGSCFIEKDRIIAASTEKLAF